jgi:microfibrillar-associated protein 1
MTQERLQAEAEAKLKEQEEIETQRKIDSKELAGETIRRELAEREAIEVVPDVDDTDGLDPAGEFDAWRARELGRLLRDKQAQAALDEEKEEIERRRAMPEAERLKEDMEYAQKTREKEKGQMGFLQKYYHKGAFHQASTTIIRCGKETNVCAGRRAVGERLYRCYGQCCGYEPSAESHASAGLWKGECGVVLPEENR